MKYVPSGSGRYDRDHGDEQFVACGDLLSTLDRLREDFILAHSTDTAKGLLCWADDERYLVQAFLDWHELVKAVQREDPHLKTIAQRQFGDLLSRMAEEYVTIEDAEKGLRHEDKE